MDFVATGPTQPVAEMDTISGSACLRPENHLLSQCIAPAKRAAKWPPFPYFVSRKTQAAASCRRLSKAIVLVNGAIVLAAARTARSKSGSATTTSM